MKLINPIEETSLFPGEVLMGNPRTTTPEALGACQLLQGSGVHSVPMHTDIFGFSKCPQEYFLSKASSSLGILSICFPTEVALGKSHWAEETAQKLSPPSSLRP